MNDQFPNKINLSHYHEHVGIVIVMIGEWEEKL